MLRSCLTLSQRQDLLVRNSRRSFTIAAASSCLASSSSSGLGYSPRTLLLGNDNQCCGGVQVSLLEDRHNWHCQKQQYRSYIFVPTSFQELLQNVRSLYDTTQERRTVWVKLVQDQYTRTKDRVVVSKTKVHRLSQRTKGRINRGNKKAILLKKQVKDRLVFHSSNLLKQAKGLRDVGAKNRITRLKTRGIESLLRYQQKTNKYLPRAYKTKPITLEEYSKADWFDENGYPQTARDERSGRFVNPWNSVSTNGHHSLFSFLSWRLDRLITKARRYIWGESTDPTLNDATGGDSKHIVLAPCVSQTNPDAIKLTWMGHSSCLVEMARGDITILTDPHFSSYAFPLDFGGPKRLVEAPKLDSLPQLIHVCAISHDHYDHLDYETVCALKDRTSWWVVPLGLKEWLQAECNVNPSQIVELQWWESTTFQKVESSLSQIKQQQQEEAGTLKITCAPAQHWCSRTPWDRNVRLWCSFAMEYNQDSLHQRFYFAGDSGYPSEFPLFRQIGDMLGPFDLAAIPIGAYAPRWFMADSHACPREALQIHKDLKSKKSVAIHWGTFDLADENVQEPPLLLQEALHEQDDEIDFVVLRHGSSVESNPDEQHEYPIYNQERQRCETS